MLAEVRHGVEVEVERPAGEERLSAELRVPAGEQAGDLLWGDPRGIFRQEALLRHGVEAAKQGKPLIGDERHDVALAFDRPQFERQRGAQRMCGRDHARTRQPGSSRQYVVAAETHQIGNEEEQPSHPGGELTLGESEFANIGHGFGGGADEDGPLLVEPARQGSEAFRGENLAHRGGAQWHALLLERPTDLVDRVVALAQGHDLFAGTALSRLFARAWMRGGEEFRQFSAAKGVTQYPESSRRIAEAPRDLGRGLPLHVEGTQGLVLALAWGRRLSEETAAFR